MWFNEKTGQTIGWMVGTQEMMRKGKGHCLVMNQDILNLES